MGHESQIELWLTPNDHVPLCWFQNRLASLRKSNEKPLTRKIQTAGPQRQPSPWRGQARQILLNHVGCEARKIPAVGEVFFLDFSLYRTYQDLRDVSLKLETDGDIPTPFFLWLLYLVKHGWVRSSVARLEETQGPSIDCVGSMSFPSFRMGRRSTLGSSSFRPVPRTERVHSSLGTSRGLGRIHLPHRLLFLRCTLLES